MTISFDLILKSETITFLVGEDRLPITVHAAAAAHQSFALDLLVNEYVTGAQPRGLVIEGIDAQTFIRFCQFAYTGTYDSFSNNGRSSDISPLDLGVPIDSMARTHLDIRSAFREWNNYPPGPQVRSTPRPELEHLNEVQDCSFILLGHAKIYSLAKRWDATSLKALALSRLHRLLCSFTLSQSRVDNVVEFARFAYSDSNGPVPAGETDYLRDLIIHYIFSEIGTFLASLQFRTFLESGGCFTFDFVREVIARFP